MKKMLGISVALTSIVLLSSCGLEKTQNIDPEENNAMIRQEEKGAAPQDGDAMMRKVDTTMVGDVMMKEQEVGYSPYSDATVDAALKEGKKVALFFHASWCPTCKVLDTSLSNETIPDSVLVLKVNYDNSLELRKKYGVTSQHTIVTIDANKNMIKKGQGEQNISQILMLF